MSVPNSYKEGAIALGAGKFKVIKNIIVPCAMPGIITAIILSMGRIIGESAALLYTSGMAYKIISHISQSGRTLTLHLYQNAKQAASENAFNVAFATAAVLLILVFVLNIIATLLSRILKK